MATVVPAHVGELTPAVVGDIIAAQWPGTRIASAEIVKVRDYGDADTALSVSTSTQISLAVRYAEPSPLPERLLAKMSFPVDMACANPELRPLFQNEVLFYNRLRSELAIESPLGLGGRYDPSDGRFILLMEDISAKRPHINSMMDADDADALAALLDTYARLHASLWGSPRFGADLGWVQNQVEGSIEAMFDVSIRQHVVTEMAREAYKREFAEELGMSETEMFEGEKALKRHFDRLPRTILHGDAHFANTYRLPDGTGGLLDWQVSTSGYALFDVTYIIQTALSVAGRRTHERALLDHYRDRLRAHGVADMPSAEAMWLDYRRALLHGFYLGWLTAPRENYGLEIAVMGNHRTKAACIDHDVPKLIAAL